MTWNPSVAARKKGLHKYGATLTVLMHPGGRKYTVLEVLDEVAAL